MSSLNDENTENDSYSQALLKEEEKWKVRAEWIEKVIDRFSKNKEKASWVPWLKAKVDCLVDLDIHFNRLKPLPPSQTQDPFQILYLQEFLLEALKN